jgi:hypothetical protein
VPAGAIHRHIKTVLVYARENKRWLRIKRQAHPVRWIGVVRKRDTIKTPLFLGFINSHSISEQEIEPMIVLKRSTEIASPDAEPRLGAGKSG